MLSTFIAVMAVAVIWLLAVKIFGSVRMATQYLVTTFAIGLVIAVLSFTLGKIGVLILLIVFFVILLLS